jgi:GNAT superfamily N-acetyltransferase
VERLTAVGLASVPTWCKPYEVLSNGERFRADLARRIRPDALIDEFSSVVDRHVAMAASRGFARLIRRRDIRGVIVATCHRDVIPWLEPDWMVDTDAGLFLPNAKECVQPASLVVEVRRCRRDAWDHFVGHHYLASSLHVFARCYIATWDSQLVGFSAAIPFPHGTIKGAWRETRTVILPEFQGLGLGVRLSDHVAALHAAEGYRYFSRTQHPRMGEHRETSPDWRATSSNRKKATPVARDARFAHWEFDANRIAYSHEYIGPAAKIRDPMMPTAEQRAKAYKPSKAHRRVDP